MSLATIATASPEALAASAVPLLEVRGVSKSFGGVTANADVSFTVPAGSVVALLGENGAGKSTVMNAVCGLYLPDEGQICMHGRPVEAGSPAAAREAGIGMVHQQFKLVDTLTAYENISLAVDRGTFLQRTSPNPDVIKLMKEVGFHLDLLAPVWSMSLAARQQLEILRVLAQGANS